MLAGGPRDAGRGLTGGTLPKALLPVAGRPFIDHKLAELARLGVERVVLLLGHGADQIVDYVGDGTGWDSTSTSSHDGDRAARHRRRAEARRRGTARRGSG